MVWYNTLCLIGSFADHVVDSMDWALQFFPDGLVHQLLSLYSAFSGELVRNYFNANVRSIGVIVGTSDFDLVGFQRLGNFLGADIDNRSVGSI